MKNSDQHRALPFLTVAKAYFCRRPARASTLMLQTTVNGKHSFSIRQEDGVWIVGSQAVSIDISRSTSGVLSILHRGKSYEAIIEEVVKPAKEVRLRINGQRYTVAIQEPIDQLLHEMGLDIAVTKKVEPIRAPMPGMVLKVLVSAGQRIAKGDGLLILEAMKMENVLKAPVEATVKNVRINERTAVGKGDVLIELE